MCNQSAAPTVYSKVAVDSGVSDRRPETVVAALCFSLQTLLFCTIERKDFTTKTFVAKKRHHKYSLLTAGVSRLVVESLAPSDSPIR
jgi:hypothetical protein